jgi:hypothetical protein
LESNQAKEMLIICSTSEGLKSVKTVVFWVVTPLKMEKAESFEILVTIYETTVL